MAENRKSKNDVDFVCIGMITAPHGVRGAVRVKSYTVDPDNLVGYGPLFDAKGKQKFKLSPVGHVRDQLIAKIEGVNDRDGAERLRGTRLHIPRTALPDTETEDEFYLADLVGLKAIHVDGSTFGTVRGVADFGAGDVIEIALEESRGKVVVLPFTRAVIPDVILSERKLVVNPPEGLLQDEDGPGNRPRRASKSRNNTQADRDSEAVTADAAGAETATGSGKEA
ncbi:16S rRNA processing protein RimM [Thalassospira profundimaris]|uniref:Ribosome maturation factor RimM n=1 Tax=Thalassospira profundimaris TaxID=502049 RepID=A0A367WKJ0_9PROT|nr:ribosome maturation factor RimM [Thalassospira profundimaris]RCK41071.1 16S rRNA processing protein RimM [Thalassospira profundimaris]